MHPKLEAQDIRLEYFQPRTNTRLVALGGVNLKVMDGEFVSIVGPSGCGKTTFLSVVDGLIAATSGRILVDGKEGVHPLDQAIAERLRKARRPVVLAVNKLDDLERSTAQLEFYELGFGEPVSFSTSTRMP